MSKIAYIDHFDSWEREFSFYYAVKVRFSETDLFGHMNNTIPFTYFEQARIEFFKHAGFMHNWMGEDSEAIPVVADLQCDFLKQVLFDEELRIYVKVKSIGRTSIDIHYLAKNANNEKRFVGRGTIVQMCKRTSKGKPWSNEMKERLIACQTLSVSCPSYE